MTCIYWRDYCKVMEYHLQNWFINDCNIHLFHSVFLSLRFLWSCKIQCFSMERPIWQPSKGSFLGNRKQGTEAFSPTTLEDPNPANNHVSLRAETFPVEPSHDTTALTNFLTTALWEILQQMTYLTLIWFLIHRQRINVCYFKSLSLVVCHTAIGN